MTEETADKQAETPAENFEVTTARPEPEEAPKKEAKAEEPEGEDEDAADGDNAEQEASEGGEPKPKKSRGVQKRIDELTSNWRTAERDRDYWRDMAMRGAVRTDQQARAETKPQSPQAPDPNKYQGGDLDPQYMSDLADYRADLKVEARFKKEAEEREQAQFREMREQQAQDFSAKAAAAGDAGESALNLTRDPTARVTPEMAEIILTSDQGVEIAAYLNDNRSEMDRIADLPAHRQAYELARIEAQTMKAPETRPEDDPAPKKPQQPLRPTPTVAGRSGAAPTKPLDQMTPAEYDAWVSKQSRPSDSAWV